MEFPPMTDQEYTQRILTRVKVANRQVIPEYVRRTSTFSQQEQIGSDMVLELTAEVLRDHVLSDYQDAEFDVPASWWQHLKQTVENVRLLRRFVKRYPVVYVTWTQRIHFDRYYDYPDARIALPEDRFGKFIVHEVTGASDWNRN
jgi:hypothetical protein